MCETNINKKAMVRKINDTKKETNVSEYINKFSVDSDEGLQTFLEFVDKTYFKGVLTKNGVKAVWSNRMTKNLVKIHR